MADILPLRSLISLTVSLMLLFLVPLQASEAKLIGLGPCPHYQAETLFTDERIEKLKGSRRYSVLLSFDPYLECMSFDFIDDARLSFNFKDMRAVDPVVHSKRGRYTAQPTLFSRRGYLRLNMERDGLFGIHQLRLIPLLFTDTYEVWGTCVDLLAVHFEHLLVMVHEPASLRSANGSSSPTSDNSTNSISRRSDDALEQPTIVAAGQDHDDNSVRLQTDASIQDNVIIGRNVTHEVVSFNLERDTAGAESLLSSRSARRTLAANIRDDLIARGFPNANALRLKYDDCAE